jgi:hypothetical protein
MITKSKLAGEVVSFWVSASLQDGMQFNKMLSSDCIFGNREIPDDVPIISLELACFSSDKCSMHYELQVLNGKFHNPSKKAESHWESLWFCEGHTTRIVYQRSAFKEAMFDYNQIEMRAEVLNAENNEEDSECTD